MSIRTLPRNPDPQPATPATSPTLVALMERYDGRLGITVEEFARAIGLSRTSAWLAVQRGEIPTRRIGRRVIVPLSVLADWLAAA